MYAHKQITHSRVTCEWIILAQYDYKPLHIAAHNGFTSIIALLLEHGGNPNTRAEVSSNPFHTSELRSARIAIVIFCGSGLFMCVCVRVYVCD